MSRMHFLSPNIMTRFACTIALIGSSLCFAASDPPTDCPDPDKNIVSIAVDDSRGSIDIQIDTEAVGTFNTLLVFIDSDNNPKTGFDAPAHPGYGYDLLIQSDSLHKFAGTDRSAWQWESVAPVKRAVADKSITLSVPAVNLGQASFGVTALYMSDDFQSLRDAAPDAKPMAFTTKLASGSAPVAHVPMAAPRADRDQPIRKRFAAAKSFYTYYGSKRVAELSHYDTVILHSPQMAKEDVKTLSDLGVVTVGYISVGEDDQLRKGDGAGPGGYASWYFDRDKNGKPDQNGIWKSYFANAADPKWRADRVAEAVRLVKEDGYNGIFLDTIDTSQNYPESKAGMIQLVSDLRNALPDSVIVLNQGFEVLPDVAKFADGLMLESFTASYDFDSKQYIMNLPQTLDFHTRRAQKTIAPVIAKHPLKVLVLDYAKPTDAENIKTAANRAATFGYLFSCAPIFLDDVYADVPAGKANPKWLTMQSSPEAMAFTLPEPRNGFPKGTEVRPSGCFAGYTIAAIVDGMMDRSKLVWSKAAWASMEDGEPAWVEFRMPTPVVGGKVHVYFHDEAGPSSSYRIDVQYVNQFEWTTIQTITGNDQRNRASELPAMPISAIRLWQAPGGGSVSRPDLMWIAQVVLEK